MLELEIKSIQNFVLQYENLKEENIKLKIKIEELEKELKKIKKD